MKASLQDFSEVIFGTPLQKAFLMNFALQYFSLLELNEYPL